MPAKKLSETLLDAIESDARPLNAIARAVGVPQSALHEFVNNRRNLGIGHVDKLAAEFLRVEPLPRTRTTPPEPTLDEMPRWRACEIVLRRAKRPLATGEILARLRADGYSRGKNDRAEYNDLYRAMQRRPETFVNDGSGGWSLADR